MRKELAVVSVGMDTPSIGEVVLLKLARVMSKRENKARNARTWFQATIKLLIHVAGFACLTYAGFTFSLAAGFVVAGLSCFTLSWLTTADSPTPPATRDPMLR